MKRVTIGFNNGTTLAITLKSFRREGGQGGVTRYAWEGFEDQHLADIDISSVIWVIEQPAKVVLEPVWGSM